jgi:hypothetical protein
MSWLQGFVQLKPSDGRLFRWSLIRQSIDISHLCLAYFVWGLYLHTRLESPECPAVAGYLTQHTAQLYTRSTDIFICCLSLTADFIMHSSAFIHLPVPYLLRCRRF